MKKNKKGFSLVEVIVAMAISSIALTMLLGSFAGFFQQYSVAKKNQKTIEDARYALALMSKTIRTSVVSTASGTSTIAFATTGVAGDNNMIKLYDNSQSRCLVYYYDSAGKKIVKVIKNTTDSDISACGYSGSFDINSPGFTKSDLTSAVVERMWARGTISTSTQVGKINVALKIRESGQVNPTNIAMTVSLRANN